MLVLAVYRLIGERSNLIPSGVMSTIDPPLEEMRPPSTRGSHAIAWGPTMVLLALLALLGVFVVHGMALKGEQLILFALSLLAVVGVFFLFASAVGMIRLREAPVPPDFARAYIEQSDDAIELLDANGQIVFTNAAMRPAAAGARRRPALRPAGAASRRRSAGVRGLFPAGPRRRTRSSPPTNWCR